MKNQGQMRFVPKKFIVIAMKKAKAYEERLLEDDPRIDEKKEGEEGGGGH